MFKGLSPQQLREFGFYELAFIREQEVGKVSIAPEKRIHNAPDNFVDGSQEKAIHFLAQTLHQLKLILSPLLSPLLKGSDGLLNLKKIPGKTFEQFKSFLETQLAVDNRSFNDFGFLNSTLGRGVDSLTHLFASYQRVIARKEFEPLLRALYRQKTDVGDEKVWQADGFRVASDLAPDTDTMRRGWWNTLMPAKVLLAFSAKAPTLKSGGEVTQNADEVPAPTEILAFLLLKFTRDWIAVSAEAFVAHLIHTQAGREILKAIIQDKTHYDADTRANILKGIASQGEASGVGGLNEHLLNKNIFKTTFLNIRLFESIQVGKVVKISEEDLDRATEQALAILEDVRWSEEKSQELSSKYQTAPQEVIRLAGLTTKQIAAMAGYQADRQSQDYPKAELQAKLAGLWLMVADSERFARARFASHENRLVWLEKIQGFIEQSQKVDGEGAFFQLNEEIRKFLDEDISIKNKGVLNGSVGEKIDNIIFHSLDYLFGHSFEDVFKESAAAIKAPYTELKQLVEENHYAWGEDARLYFDPVEIKSTDPKIKRAAALMIQGLQKTKRGMWYAYKQRSELSRSISWFTENASFGFLGDKSTLREANGVLNGMIQGLKSAQTEKDIRVQMEKIPVLLEEDGVLHEAFKASEFDGWEHMTQLLQTVSLFVGTAVVARGLGSGQALSQAANLLKARNFVQGGQLSSEAIYLKNTGLMTGIKNLHQFRQAGRLGEVLQLHQDSKRVAAMGEGLFAVNNAKAVRWITAKGQEVMWGLSLGALTPLEENLLNKLGDRVGSQEKDMAAMVKDSMATSLAMGFFSPWAMAMGRAIQGNIFKAMWQRYSGANAVHHFLWDGAVEFHEELFDQSLRMMLEGKKATFTTDQIRETGIVSFAGGGTKMNALVQGFRPRASQIKDLNSGDPTGQPGHPPFHGGMDGLGWSTANGAPLENILAMVDSPGPKGSGKAAKKIQAAQSSNRKVLQGEMEEIKSKGIYYVIESESIGGNAGHSRFCINAYVDPETGQITAVGNSQNIPEKFRQGKSLVSFLIHFNFLEWKKSPENYQRPIEEVHFPNDPLGVHPPLKEEIKQSLLQLRGETFNEPEWGYRPKTPS